MFLPSILSSFLPNWQSETKSIIGHLTLFDISLPGSHDTMTYDLSENIADNANDIPPYLSYILHDLVPDDLIGKFIRDQAKTQGLTITEQLDSGIRFVDFRVVYTRGPDKIFGAEDWYCLHLLESKKTALVYLREIYQWVKEHPEEILVVYMSRHGNNCARGVDQYPGTTPEIRQKFFEEVRELFSDVLFDTEKNRLNETSINKMIESSQRVVLYVADYKEFTDSTSYAYDACQYLINEGTDGGVTNETASLDFLINLFSNTTKRRNVNKAKNQYYLQSTASSSPVAQIEYAALLTYQPFQHEELIKSCSSIFNMPGVTKWCPLHLQDMSQAREYYNQRALEYAYQNNLLFPNAFYTDAIDHDGTFRTGVELFEHTSSNSGDKRYAYVPTVIGTSIKHQCRISPSPQCTHVMKTIDSLRNLYPIHTSNDPDNGRLQDWPPFPRLSPDHSGLALKF